MVQPLIPLEEIGDRRVGSNRGGIRQKYFLDEPGRRLIQALYDGTPERITELAARLHVPRQTVKRWGSQLGLARKKEPNWTEQDMLYLETHLHKQSLASIAQHLGRTKVAVKLKAKRLGFNKTKEGHTMRGLCLALGCDHHKVERWLKQGWLQGTRRETEKASNDYWLFTDQDIRTFVLAHPLEIDQRRMDWLFMVDLLSDSLPSSPLPEVRPGKEKAMHIDIEDNLQIDIDQLANKNVAVLGITRSGKTNTAMVLIEELFVNSIPMTIVDIDEEYRCFKERYPLIIAGTGSKVEYTLTAENAGALAHRSIDENLSVLLDMSDYDDLQDCRFILAAYFNTLWREAAIRKHPYQIVIEEAHEWLPEEGATTALKELLARIASRGLRRGLRLMLISQRSANVAKDALTQTALLFLHRVVHPVDYAVYQRLVPLPGAQVSQMISGLKVGQAIVVTEETPQVYWIRAAGSRPIQPDIKTILRKRVKELEEKVSEQEIMISSQAILLARIEEAYPDLMDAVMETERLAHMEAVSLEGERA